MELKITRLCYVYIKRLLKGRPLRFIEPGRYIVQATGHGKGAVIALVTRCGAQPKRDPEGET